MPGKSFRPNQVSKGNLIEVREFYARDVDFRQMTQVVPFPPTQEPVAQCWYQRTTEGAEVFCVGIPTKTPDQRLLQPLHACDRAIVKGDTSDTMIEARAFRHPAHSQQMYKVRPRGVVPGYACMAWWEVENPEKPDEGSAKLCIGLVQTKEGQAVKDASPDGLEASTMAQLKTLAGREGVKYDETMNEGEIIARIRDARAKKAKKKSEKTQEPVAV
jgi:hypothetical protein